MNDTKVHIGMTGTRKGMTDAQKDYWRVMTNTLSPGIPGLMIIMASVVLHHGGAIGADKDAHDIALEAGMEIVVHMPVKKDDLAEGMVSDGPLGKVTLTEEFPYLTRNKHIVEASTMLYVFPSHFEEIQRSGTWSTKRYAEKIKKEFTIVYPDGTTS